MKGEKEKIIVGKKPGKKRLVVTTICSMMGAFIIGKFIANLIGGGDYLFIFLSFIGLELIYLPIIASNINYWMVDSEYLGFYSIDSYREQLKCAWCSLIGKEYDFSFKINIKKIERIKIKWKSSYGIWMFPMHSIYFNVLLKDGSTIVFNSLTTTNTEEFIEAVKFLKNQCYIVIEDDYDLLKALQNPNINLANYIDELIKRKNGESIK